MKTRRVRSYHQVAGADHDVIEQVTALAQRLTDRLAAIRNIIVVASGKGGVGKSAVAANVAAGLAARDRRVGALDADLNGPTLARMLGVAGQRPVRGLDGVAPARGVSGVAVMSMDLLLPSDDAPLRWRRPAGEHDEDAGHEPPEALWQSNFEAGVLREFLADTRWGELDHLVIDAPPGTDKLVRLVQLLPRIDAVCLVTTPSMAAQFVVAKSATVCADAGVTRVGLVANMTAHSCEHCGHTSALFDGDARLLARAAGLPLWAEVPFDGRLAANTDAGRPLVTAIPDAPAARALTRLTELLDTHHGPRPERDDPEATE